MSKVHVTKDAKDTVFENCKFHQADFINDGDRTTAQGTEFIGQSGPIEGVEIYARNINNSGKISSNTYTKIVAENYNSSGEVSANSNKEDPKKWHSTWWGLSIITIICSLMVAGITYFLGWS